MKVISTLCVEWMPCALPQVAAAAASCAHQRRRPCMGCLHCPDAPFGSTSFINCIEMFRFGFADPKADPKAEAPSDGQEEAPVDHIAAEEVLKSEVRTMCMPALCIAPPPPPPPPRLAELRCHRNCPCLPAEQAHRCPGDGRHLTRAVAHQGKLGWCILCH